MSGRRRLDGGFERCIRAWEGEVGVVSGENVGDGKHEKKNKIKRRSMRAVVL